MLQINGVVQQSPVEALGAKLNEIASKARRGSEGKFIGSLYGFQLGLKTEVSQKEGSEIYLNRFFIRGEGQLSYNYNNGIMAKDPETAAMHFLKALEKIPNYIQKQQKTIAGLRKDILVLKTVVDSYWIKEDMLSNTKTQIAAIERKIHLVITQQKKENDNDIEQTIGQNYEQSPQKVQTHTKKLN